ncbi:HutD family protein [Actinoplanes sp. CA-015351]|uniref:HutD family protein n=1 Tax=Actinoplanes sp. CA-015351 TaxID=3239897 RepID=UPI003D97B0A0
MNRTNDPATPTVIATGDVERRPWRNGLGSTRELATGSTGWRLSLADITTACAFSRFPGLWRWSTAVAGPSVEMVIGDRDAITVADDVVVDYDGEAPATARPTSGGVTHLLNLMAPMGTPARLTRARLDGPIPVTADTVAVFVLDGTLLAGHQQATAGHQQATAGQLMLLGNHDGLTLTGHDARCVIVEVPGSRISRR